MIGIVASRLVERYSRPVVLIAGTDDAVEGLGPLGRRRSTCTAALAACAAHLERFGGHRAAAGLTIRAEQVEVFAAAFAAHADAVLSDDDLRPRHARRRDRRRAPSSTLELCEELGRIAPFGLGNPAVTLLVDGCELVRPRRRSATASTCASASASADATRARRSRSASARSSTASGREQRYDVAFRLQENRWNGVVSPQLVVRRVFDAVDGFDELRAWLAAQWQAGEAAWTPEARAIFAELELADGVRRSLLESPTFRALLENKPTLASAA